MTWSWVNCVGWLRTPQESEVLTPADDQHHIGKHAFKVPFVCGCKNLGEALRRISEGAA
jgi:pyridoxal 5'-phosphate synthase pdxS subunit